MTTSILTFKRVHGLTTCKSWQHPTDFIPCGDLAAAQAELSDRWQSGDRRWHITTCLVEMA